MNKKGIELSINFVVILIITLIVFAGSITIAAKLMSRINVYKEAMDKQTEDRLESMINSGNEEVVIAFNKKDVRGGESVVFGLGVLNKLGVQKDFKVNVTPSQAVAKDGSVIPDFTSTNPLGWSFLSSMDIGSIKNNDHKITPLVIISSKNALPGATYIFDVKVTYQDGSNYLPYPSREPIKKIRVTVI